MGEYQVIPDRSIGTWKNPQVLRQGSTFFVHPLIMPFPDQTLQQWLDSLTEEMIYAPV